MFQNFESNHKTKVGLADEDFVLILKQCNLGFITQEIPPGVYTNGDNIEYIDDISKGGIKKENDDFTMNTKLFERSKIMRFDDKTFFNTILGFELHWYYNPHHKYSTE